MSGARTCLDCSAEIPVEDGLRAWCERCNWNVGGETTPPEEGYVRSPRWICTLDLIDTVFFAAKLIAQLLWVDKQRSEYFADYLAATISGTDAAVSSLQRLQCKEHLDDVLLRNVYSTSQSGAFILGLFRDRASSLPDRKWERLARANLPEGARLDASHPPTAYRRSFVRAHAVEKPRITSTENVMRAIDAELSTLQETLGKRLIARHA
jgi:hypothetical protein